MSRKVAFNTMITFLFLLFYLMMRKYTHKYITKGTHETACIRLNCISLCILVKFFVIQIKIFSFLTVNVVKPIADTNILWMKMKKLMIINIEVDVQLTWLKTVPLGHKKENCWPEWRHQCQTWHFVSISA